MASKAKPASIKSPQKGKQQIEYRTPVELPPPPKVDPETFAEIPELLPRWVDKEALNEKTKDTPVFEDPAGLPLLPPSLQKVTKEWKRIEDLLENKDSPKVC